MLRCPLACAGGSVGGRPEHGVRRARVFRVGYLVFGVVLLAALFFVPGLSGMRMVVEHPLQRTVLPLALVGTPSTFRQSRLGHMIRIVSSIGSHSRCLREIGPGVLRREPDLGGGIREWAWMPDRAVCTAAHGAIGRPYPWVLRAFHRVWGPRGCVLRGSRERDRQR